jgi:hypothetical protein
VGQVYRDRDQGSRLVGVPSREDTVRGFSAVSLILVDEAARVPDEMYHSVRPMLAVGYGAFWLMSTPLGKRGFFWEAWDRGKEPWTRISVPTSLTGEAPRLCRGGSRSLTNPDVHRDAPNVSRQAHE